MSLRAVLAAGCAVALTGCGLLGDDDSPEPAPLPPMSSQDSESSSPSVSESTREPRAGRRALSRFYDQELQWRACREDAECTRVEVPLDYLRPEGRTIELSVIRVRADDQDDKVGSLLVNPGGPGASGVGYAASASYYFGEPVTDHFDVVGFDPRGVGESAPIDCLSDEQLDTFLASEPDPDRPAEVAEAAALMRQFGEGCLERSGRLTRHVSTEEAARDMDIIRAALGQQRMLYFGASYGTFLGATYAELFPRRVGRMVFDAAIDPSVRMVEFTRTQARGFETALRSYVAGCLRSDGCPLDGDVDQGVGQVQDLLAQLDRDPLPTGTERELTEGLALYGIWAPLYNEASWPALDTALGAALDGDGSVLLQLADGYVGRGPDGYADNSFEALYAVNCLDRDTWIEPREVDRWARRMERVSPTFGRVMAFGMTSCGSWSVHSGKQPQELRAEGSEPIMVVGTSRDPATPLEWSEGLAAQLDAGVLVRRDGDGHTGYNAGNECVDDVVEAYLIAGEVPRRTVSC